MDSLTADILLNVIQFLNVRDNSRLSQTSSRYFYLVRQYQRLRGPELVASTSHDPTIKTRQKSSIELCQDAVSKLQSTPNLALAFSTQNEPLAAKLPSLLPNDTVILEAVAECIQSSGIDNQVECKSRASLMLASLPQARVYPFCLEGSAMDVSADGSVSRLLVNMAAESQDWKVFIVNVAGQVGGAESFVVNLQARFPEATIVGGLCLHGAVSVPVDTSLSKEDLNACTTLHLLELYRSLGATEKTTGMMKTEVVDKVFELQQTKQFRLAQVQRGIFGIALGGEVPFRAVVSRGVKSLIHDGPPQASTSYYVEEADILFPDENEDVPPLHLIRMIRNQEDGKLYSPLDFYMRLGNLDLVGIRRGESDGFEIHSPFYGRSGLFLVCNNRADSETSLVGANIDHFELDGEACCLDVDRKMQLLKEETTGERILGAIMYSCNGRGPMAGGIINEDMADAKRFAKNFPHIPCLGFYANGEIGPMALAGRRSIFQTGNACVQGFTAVFALFIVPNIDLGSFELNDSAENVQTFIKKELQGPDTMDT